jgi:hypothetical protein
LTQGWATYLYIPIYYYSYLFHNYIPSLVSLL